MAVATFEDVAVAIGRPISEPEEQAQVDYWLGAAEMVIAARLGDVSKLDAAAVRYVETEAVSARMQNPNGYQSETIDDYTYRYGTSSTRVVILDEWWALLNPAASLGAHSVRPGFEADNVRWAGNNDLYRGDRTWYPSP
jgi:hypothetical protein